MPINITPQRVTVTTSATVIYAPDATKETQDVTITNTCGGRVWLAFLGETPIVGNGVYLETRDSVTVSDVWAWGGIQGIAETEDCQVQVQAGQRGLPRVTRGTIDNIPQDLTTFPEYLYFTQIQGAPTTIAVETVVDTNTITLADATGCSIGDYFGCFNTAGNRSYFGVILNIAGNVLTMDSLLDFAFQVGDTAACLSRDLNVDGSVTPQVFSIQVGPNATTSLDINRLMINMLTDSAVSLATFGDLPALTNGCLLRITNGTKFNVFNVKSNADIANLCYDYDPKLATNPSQGQHGANFRNTFNGQDKLGVAIRVKPGDRLDWIVQDDLTGLQQLRLIGEGHLTSEGF